MRLVIVPCFKGQTGTSVETYLVWNPCPLFVLVVEVQEGAASTRQHLCHRYTMACAGPGLARGSGSEFVTRALRLNRN